MAPSDNIATPSFLSFCRSQTLSRSAYAKLYTAGFDQVTDRHGEPPDVVDPSDKVKVIMAKEEADRLQANEVFLQFLAYSRYTTLSESIYQGDFVANCTAGLANVLHCFRMLSFDSGGGDLKQPSTIFFTFQFYRFPQVTTERFAPRSVPSRRTGGSYLDSPSLNCLQ